MPTCTADDILGTMPVDNVAAWYWRLAAHIGARRVRGREPLASRFLSLYLAPQTRTAPEGFECPPYVREHSLVRQALLHHRNVYLSREQMRTGGGGRRWAGIRPRWSSPTSYGWNGRDPIAMHYEALVEVPQAWQVVGNEVDRDILYALGLGFQLRTEVRCRVTPSSGGLDVVFETFTAQVNDRYDFDPREHFTVPNPDYRSTAGGAVCPHKETIRVFHRNAQRMERAHRAAPYDIESDPWPVSNARLSGPSVVTP